MDANYHYVTSDMVVSRVFIDKDYVVVRSEQRAVKFICEEYTRFDKLIHPDDVKAFYEFVERGETSREVFVPVRLYNRDMGYRPCILFVLDRNHVMNGISYTEIEFRDLAAMVGKYDEIDLKVRKYRSFMGMIPEHFFDYDLETGFLSIYCYRDFRAETLERDLIDEIYKKSMRLQYVEDDSVEKFNTLFEKIRNCEENFTVELETSFLHKGNAKETLVFHGQALYYNNKKVQTIGIITPAVRIMKDINSIAAPRYDENDKDPATGILNKKAIAEYAQNHIDIANNSNTGSKIWLGICDIDNFKSVNDTYGHMFGDEVIYKFANTLNRYVMENGVVGRFGGDEFMFMIDGSCGEDQLRSMLRDVRQELEWAFKDKVTDYRFTTSIGVACYPKDSTDYDTLFKTADRALYIAKEKGRDRYIIYNPDLHGKLDATGSVSGRMSTMKPFAKAEMAGDMISLLYTKGSEAIPYILNTIIDQLNIHGITVYEIKDGGLTMRWTAGKYVIPFENKVVDLGDEYYNNFNDSGVCKIDNVKEFEVHSPKTYKFLTEHKICSTLRFMVEAHDKTHFIVSFDIMGVHRRKWSENDVEILYLIMKFMGNVLES